MKKFLTVNTLLICLAGILATFTLTFPFVRLVSLVDTGPSWWGLDISWEMTVNYALENKWVWGKDIIYTYGPLGFLTTRLGLGISKWTYLAFDIFIAFNFFIAFLDFLNCAKDKWTAFFLILGVLLATNTGHGGNLAWVLLFFSFVWMYRTFYNPRVVYFLLLSLNIMICFYLKLNTGLICILLMTGHLVNLLIFKKIKWLYAVIIFIGLVSGIVIASFILNVSLLAYIKGASEIIKGYNDIMHLDMDFSAKLEQKVAILYYAFLFFLVVYAISLLRNRQYSQLFFAGVALVYMFLLRKQTCLRNDDGHYYDFFAYSPILLLSPFFLKPFEKMQQPLALCMLLLAMVPLLYKAEIKDGLSVNEMVLKRFTYHADYLTSFKEYGRIPSLNNKHKRYIPERILNQVQDKTVDIFPWDSEYLLENHLNYKPRPVFQSFSSYTPYLQKANYAHYQKNGPEYVIYDFETIDGRYPFNDDLLVNFFIVKNYTFADSFTSNERWRTLLKRKTNISPLIQEKIKSTVYAFGNDIPVDNATMIRANIEFLPKGKFESVYYTTPRVAISMMRENGEWNEYKISGQLLEAGIFVGGDIKDNHDFVKYMNDKNSVGKIVKLKILADNKFYKDNIRVEYYNIK